MKKITLLNILLLALVFSACKTYLPIDRIKPKVQKDQQRIAFEERQLERLHVGDSLQIEQSEVDPLFLIFHSVSTDSIKGVVWKRGAKKLEVPIDSGVPINQVKSIKVRKKDGTKTLLFVGIGFPVLIFGIGLIVVAVSGIGITGGW